MGSILKYIIFFLLLSSFELVAQNDACGSATVLSVGTTTGTSVGSTTVSTDPVPSCESAANKCSYTVWYAYTTGATGGNLTVAMTHVGIQYAAISIYSGSCGALTQLGCNDPNSSTANPSVTVTCLSASTTYYIMIWSDGSTPNAYPGTFSLTTTFTASNDCCNSAYTLSTGATTGTTTASYTNTSSDPVPSCESAAGKCNYTAWYTYTTGASEGNLTVSLASGTIKYAALTLYSGTCGSFTELSCTDQQTVSAASPTVSATCLSPSTTYYLMVWCDGSAGSGYEGTYTLTTSFTTVTVATNDLCGNAIALSTGTVSGNNLCTTTSASDPTSTCDGDGNYSYSVWYTYTPVSSGNLTVSLANGSIQYAAMATYSGTCGSFTQLSCSDPYSSTASPTVTASCLSAGTTYYVMVWCDGVSAANAGTFTLTTAFSAAVSNDCCVNPTTISSGTSYSVSNSGYTYNYTDPIASCESTVSDYQNTAWYEFTTGGSYGSLTVTLTESNSAAYISYPSMALFSGTCGNFQELDCVVSSTQHPASTSVSAQCLFPNTTYYLMVWDNNSTTNNYSGNFTLTPTFVAGGNNDCCNNPTVLPANGTTAGTNANYTEGPNDPIYDVNCENRPWKYSYTAWYTYSVTANCGNLSISLARGTIQYASMELFSGSCGNFTSIACAGGSAAVSTTTPTLSVTGLPQGNYYLMVYCDGNTLEANSYTATGFGGTYSLTTSFTTVGTNDCCENATSISSTGTVTTTGTNSGYALAFDDPNPSCDALSPGDGSIEATAWFSYTMPTAGNLSVKLTPTSIKYAALTLYSGSCGNFTEIACSDPNTSAGAPSINPCLTAGTYYIMVWTDSHTAGNEGTFTLTTSYSTSTNTLSPTSITMNAVSPAGSYQGTVATTNTAVASGSTNSYCFNANKPQYYSFAAPVAGSYYVGMVAGTMIYPQISVMQANGCALNTISCAGYLGGVMDARDIPTTGGVSTYSLGYSPFTQFSKNYSSAGACNLAAGEIVYIMADNFNGKPSASGTYTATGTAGTFTLTVARVTNDDIANPTIINQCGYAFSGSTIGGTNCSNQPGNGLYTGLDNNLTTSCSATPNSPTACGDGYNPNNVDGAGSGADPYGHNGYTGYCNTADGTTVTPTALYQANLNGGDVGYETEDDSWFEFTAINTTTVTITLLVNGSSCLVPDNAKQALQFSAFSGSASNLTKIWGGVCFENITTSATFSFVASTNVSYFFEIDGFTGTNCNYTLQADMIPVCALPVKLLYFTGNNEQGRIKLDWATAEEQNAGKYVIERSDNGIDYNPIITIQAKGNTTEKTNYTAYDENPIINKINYYKLSEYDLNGNGGLLAQTFVSNTAGFPKFNVYPNPSNGIININIRNFAVPSIVVEITDVFGNTVWTSKIDLINGNSLQQIDLSILTDGVCFVTTSDGTNFYKQSIIISK